MYATAQEDEGQVMSRSQRKMRGWKPSPEDGNIDYRKTVMGVNEAENKDSLAIQKNFEEAGLVHQSHHKLQKRL